MTTRLRIVLCFGRLLALATLFVDLMIFVGLLLELLAPQLDVSVVLGHSAALLSSETNSGWKTILAIAIWTSLLAISQLICYRHFHRQQEDSPLLRPYFFGNSRIARP